MERILVIVLIVMPQVDFFKFISLMHPNNGERGLKGNDIGLILLDLNYPSNYVSSCLKQKHHRTLKHSRETDPEIPYTLGRNH